MSFVECPQGLPVLRGLSSGAAMSFVECPQGLPCPSWSVNLNVDIQRELGVESILTFCGEKPTKLVWTHDEDGHGKIPTAVLPMDTDRKKACGETQAES